MRLCVIPRLFPISWVPGKLQEKVKTLEKESLRKDEALDDAQHQLQEGGRGKIVVHYGGFMMFNEINDAGGPALTWMPCGVAKLKAAVYGSLLDQSEIPWSIIFP